MAFGERFGALPTSLGRGEVIADDAGITLRTEKNSVHIGPEHVVKRFRRQRGGARKWRLEHRALQRLRDVEGVPSLMDADAATLSLTMERLDGVPVTEDVVLDEAAIADLRRIVESGLECGVARHAMPRRDLLLCAGGRLAVVDFERVTLRRWRYGLIWRIACIIARYHLARRIAELAPQCLTEAERRRFRWQVAIRDRFTRIRRAVKGR